MLRDSVQASTEAGRDGATALLTAMRVSDETARAVYDLGSGDRDVRMSQNEIRVFRFLVGLDIRKMGRKNATRLGELIEG